MLVSPICRSGACWVRAANAVPTWQATMAAMSSNASSVGVMHVQEVRGPHDRHDRPCQLDRPRDVRQDRGRHQQNRQRMRELPHQRPRPRRTLPRPQLVAQLTDLGEVDLRGEQRQTGQPLVPVPGQRRGGDRHPRATEAVPDGVHTQVRHDGRHGIEG